MIQMNFLQHEVEPVVTRMPVAEFGGGRVGVVEGRLYEIQVSEDVTFVFDEQQLIVLTYAILGALPPMYDADDSDEGGVRA